jgi:hypothetical protein
MLSHAMGMSRSPTLAVERMIVISSTATTGDGWMELVVWTRHELIFWRRKRVPCMHACVTFVVVGENRYCMMYRSRWQLMDHPNIQRNPSNGQSSPSDQQLGRLRHALFIFVKLAQGTCAFRILSPSHLSTLMIHAQIHAQAYDGWRSDWCWS